MEWHINCKGNGSTCSLTLSHNVRNLQKVYKMDDIEESIGSYRRSGKPKA
jgi:hypothetical protein